MMLMNPSTTSKLNVAVWPRSLIRLTEVGDELWSRTYWLSARPCGSVVPNSYIWPRCVSKWNAVPVYCFRVCGRTTRVRTDVPLVSHRAGGLRSENSVGLDRIAPELSMHRVLCIPAD